MERTHRELAKRDYIVLSIVSGDQEAGCFWQNSKKLRLFGIGVDLAKEITGGDEE